MQGEPFSEGFDVAGFKQQRLTKWFLWKGWRFWFVSKAWNIKNSPMKAGAEPFLKELDDQMYFAGK